MLALSCFEAMALVPTVLLLVLGSCLCEPLTDIPDIPNDECRADAECSLSMLQLSGQKTSTLAIDDADNTTMDGDNTTMENGALAKRSGFKHFAYYPYRMGGQTCQRGTSNASPVETSP